MWRVHHAVLHMPYHKLRAPYLWNVFDGCFSKIYIFFLHSTEIALFWLFDYIIQRTRVCVCCIIANIKKLKSTCVYFLRFHEIVDNWLQKLNVSIKCTYFNKYRTRNVNLWNRMTYYRLIRFHIAARTRLIRRVSSALTMRQYLLRIQRRSNKTRRLKYNAIRKA